MNDCYALLTPGATTCAVWPAPLHLPLAHSSRIVIQKWHSNIIRIIAASLTGGRHRPLEPQIRDADDAAADAADAGWLTAIQQVTNAKLSSVLLHQLASFPSIQHPAALFITIAAGANCRGVPQMAPVERPFYSILTWLRKKRTKGAKEKAVQGEEDGGGGRGRRKGEEPDISYFVPFDSSPGIEHWPEGNARPETFHPEEHSFIFPQIGDKTTTTQISHQIGRQSPPLTTQLINSTTLPSPPPPPKKKYSQK